MPIARPSAFGALFSRNASERRLGHPSCQVRFLVTITP
jgi:hypothetical protein